MAGKFGLLRAIGRALIKQLGNAAGLGLLDLGSLAVDAWDAWDRDQKEDQRRQEIEALARSAASEIREAILSLLREDASRLTPAQQQQLAQYLEQVPSAVRRSLRSGNDPAGRTVPAHLPLRTPGDLVAFLPPRMPRFKIGDRPLPGVDWELTDLLGVGGFGEVWKARNPHFDGVAPVALKFCLDPASRERLLRHEAAVVNQLLRQGRHPGIVSLLRTYLSADPPCLEYEYVAGGDLAQAILEWHHQDRAGLPRQALRSMAELAAIVGHAHSQSPPLVHRDLKPSNILCPRNPDGSIQFKVADFGIGAIVADQALSEQRTGLSRFQNALTEAVRGAYTPLYASPQQQRGESPSPADDVHALGVVWLQMLTGDLGRGFPSGQAWQRGLLERGLTRQELDLLIRCVEDDPVDRLPNARVLADEIRAILTPRPEPIRPVQPAPPAPARPEPPRPAAPPPPAQQPLAQQAPAPPAAPKEPPAPPKAPPAPRAAPSVRKPEKPVLAGPVRWLDAGWALSLLRGLRPDRLLICLFGAALSLWLIRFLTGLFPGRSGSFGDQFDVSGLAREVGAILSEVTSGAGLLRLMVFLLPLSLLWAPLAGCLLRQEMLAACRGEVPTLFGSAGFVSRRLLRFLLPLPLTMLALLLLLLPVLLAGLVDRFLGAGIGAVLVALALPVFFLCSLIAVLLALGWLTFPLMPATVAAEGADGWEALSRSLSYGFQQSFAYLTALVLTAIVAAIPAGLVLWLSSQRLFLPGFPGLVLGLALGLSCFWSLQARVYLKLRHQVDDAGEDEVYLEDEEYVAAVGSPAPPEAPPAPAPAPAPQPARQTLAGTPQPFTLTDARSVASRPARLMAVFPALAWAMLILWAGLKTLCGSVDPVVVYHELHDGFVYAPARVVLTLAGLAVVAAFGIAPFVRMAQRDTYLFTLQGERFSLTDLRGYARRTWNRGWPSLILLTLGLEGILLGLLLLLAAWQGELPWTGTRIGLGAGMLLLLFGSYGMGRIVVEERGLDQGRLASVRFFSAGPVTSWFFLRSLIVSLVAGALTIAVAGVAWSLMLELMGWWGGEREPWLAFSLEGIIWPEAAGLRKVARAVAGFWFLAFAAWAISVLVGRVLSAGVALALLARRTWPEGPTPLTPEEEGTSPLTLPTPQGFEPPGAREPQ